MNKLTARAYLGRSNWQQFKKLLREMNKQFSIFIAMFFLLTCLTVFNKANGQNRLFSLGVYDTVHSVILNQERRILVYVPARENNNNVRYPVMYLLDGEHHFTKTVGIIDHLSNTAGNELCPQMIVVAIFSNNRERDFIPSANPDKFPMFLEKELIPYIDTHYPTQPYRIFTGHSLGGLRVINTLIYQPQLFQSYVALDPSLGHVKGWINKAIEDYNKNTYINKSVYIAMGLTMPKGMDTSVIFNDTSGAARHMRSIMLFAKNADKNKTNAPDFKWKYYPDETHQSVVFRGTYDGIISNFYWFKNENLFDIFKTDVDAKASVKIISDYYERISQKFGYNITPPEQGTAELIDYLNFKRWFDKALAFAQLNYKNYPSSQRTKTQLETAKWNSKKSILSLYPSKTVKEIYRFCKKEAAKKEPEYNISEDAINTFGYELMQQNKLAEAEIIFRLNIELYPTSYNVYDSYGECLVNLGNKEKGIAAYKKSLELNPQNTNALNILKRLNSTE